MANDLARRLSAILDLREACRQLLAVEEMDLAKTEIPTDELIQANNRLEDYVDAARKSVSR
jgi:hypothetical protein